LDKFGKVSFTKIKENRDFKILICDSDVYINPCFNVCYELQLKGNWVLVIVWAKLEQFESLSSCVILVSNVRYILGVYKSIILVLVSW
jgi:hypothetical protein